MQSISPSERINRFIDNIRELLFQLTADSHNDSAKRRGAGRIVGPIAFYTMGKIIYRRETITVGELTKELLIPPSTATRLVTWWVNNGLAERMTCPPKTDPVKDIKVVSRKELYNSRGWRRRRYAAVVDIL